MNRKHVNRLDAKYPDLRARNPRRADIALPRLELAGYAAWPDFWRAVDGHLHACGYTRSTRMFYRNILRAFTRFAQTPPAGTTRDNLQGYLRRLADRQPTWHWTAMNISVLRTVFDKLAGLNALTRLRGPRRKRTIPEYLDRADIARLLAAATTLRDQLVIALLYGCGLKTGELQEIRWRDIDPEGGVLQVTSRFTGDRRVLRLPLAVIPFLRYGKAQCPAEERLFSGAKPDRPLTARSIQRILIGCASVLKRPVTPNMLRHSYAVHFLQDGGNIRELQEALDHQTLEATMRYQDLAVGVANPEQSSPIQMDPGWEDLTAPIFPLQETRPTFLHILHAQCKGRFLALRRFFSSA